MKKIYAYLLGVTYILSTSCSEMQRKQLFPDNIYVSTQAIPIPIYVNSDCLPQLQQPQQRYLCTVNQPGWEILNKIANAPYTANKPIVKKTTDLEPIYRPTISTNNATQLKKTITPQEKKPSLQSIVAPKEPENCLVLMRQLYNDAYYILYDGNSTPKNQLAFNSNLIDLIINLKRAKDKLGVHEDLMATYAYEKWNLVNDLHYYVATLFYCLKKYNLTTAKTPEDLPNNHDICTISLSTGDDFLKILGIENKEPISPEKRSSSGNRILQEYPTYGTLISSLYQLSQSNIVNIKTLVSYLHSKQEIITKNYPQNSYDDLKKIFYSKAYDLLFIKKICNKYKGSNDLYDLLEIVDQIKDDHKKQELELGHDILALEKTDPLAKVLNSISPGFFYDIYSKNLISVLCKLIKNYNDESLNKITPTDEQCFCYLAHKKINFTLPDSFASNLFDENKYALIEFLQLFDNIVQLKRYDAGSVQLFVDKMYPKKD